MKISLRTRLYNFIANREYATIYQLNVIAKENYYKESNAERILRKLRQEGKIERVMKGNVLTAYKFIK